MLSNSITMNTPEFDRVLICNIRKRDTRIPVQTEEEYMKEFKAKNKQTLTSNPKHQTQNTKT